MGVLHRRHRNIAPLQPGVRATLNEMYTGHGWQAQQVIHGKNLWLFDQTIDHQAVLRRINIDPPLMMALEVQTARRNNAEQSLQGRERHRRGGDPSQAGRFTALQIRFNIDWVWDGSPAILQSRAVDSTGYVQPPIRSLRAIRGSRSIYHNNAIQSWEVGSNGEVSNVQVG